MPFRQNVKKTKTLVEEEYEIAAISVDVENMKIRTPLKVLDPEGNVIEIIADQWEDLFITLEDGTQVPDLDQADFVKFNKVMTDLKDLAYKRLVHKGVLGQGTVV